ncbi:hypothetical protein [Aeromonas veronii]|nr:hypothetical protein [Aeromonas veronii]
MTVNNGSYTDLNGNVGTGNSDDTAIDTQAPTWRSTLLTTC